MVGKKRENLMKELDRERMLRADAEQRLKDMTYESENTKSRLLSLQAEFKKMEEMVRSMVSYKHKIDALKQEKSNLICSYEASVAKYQSHVKKLDRENRMLVAEIKKLESQTSGSRSSEDAESKTKVLLERLKMLEAENSALVLENESQRQQYEKCLDSIANQVVQALLTQKSLREECAKLQKRVIDLEQQNRELNQMFHQRIKFASDSALQAAMARVSGGQGSGSSSTSCRSPEGSSNGSHASLAINTQLPALAEGGATSRPGGEQAASACSYDSIFSLHSLCSDYNENSQSEDTLGKPEMSSPPPWLREKVNFNFGSGASSSTDQAPSLSNLDHSPMVSPTSPEHCLSPLLKEIVQGIKEIKEGDETVTKEICSDRPQGHVEFETEFPINNSSPKLKHVYYKHVTAVSNQQNLGRKLTEALCGGADPNSVETAPSGVNAEKDSPSRARQPIKCSHKLRDSSEPVVHRDSHESNSPVKLVPVQSQSQSQPSNRSPTPQPCDQAKVSLPSGHVVSPGQELLKLADSFNEKFLVNEKDGLPHIQNNLFDTDSEEEGSSRPISNAFSAASTVSLNELLERELDEMETPNDEGFTLDALPIFEALSARYDDQVAKLVGESVANEEVEDIMERDPACGWSDSKLSKSSSQSESSVQSQRFVISQGGDSVIVNNEQVSNSSSSSTQRPTTLQLGQGSENSDSSSGSDSELPTPNNAQSLESTLLKNQIDGTNIGRCRIPSLTTSPKHKFHNLSKSNTSLRGSTKENHPLKLYNVQSPPGSNEEILEKFKRQPPKTKPKPSIKMRFRRKSQGDGKECDPKGKTPTETRPEVDGREATVVERGRKSGNAETRRSDLVNTVGIQESLDSADPMTSSCSSGSPDSAMQQSFSSSSSSDNTLSDKPSCRDDGYLSNSTISMSSTDVPGDGSSHIQPASTSTGSGSRPEGRAQQGHLRRRSQPQSGTGLEPHFESEAESLSRRRSEPQYENTNMNANPTEGASQKRDGCVSADNPMCDVNFGEAGLDLSKPGCRDSVASNVSETSIESNPIGRVRDIKAFFESKVDEKLRCRIQEAEQAHQAKISESKSDSVRSCHFKTRPPVVGTCDKNNIVFSRSRSNEDKSSCRGGGLFDPKGTGLTSLSPSDLYRSEDVLLDLITDGSPRLRRSPSDSYLIQSKYCVFYTTKEQYVSLSQASRQKIRLPRLQRCWSDSRLETYIADVHRKESKTLHLTLKQDWAKFCSKLYYQKRSLSAPASNGHQHQKRSASPSAPRLLTRRSQRNQSCESVRLNGEGAESQDGAQSRRPEAVGCASRQGALKATCEGFRNRHWGRSRRVTPTEKNWLNWSSGSEEEDFCPGERIIPRGGTREGLSPVLPEWRQAQVAASHPLGVRRRERHLVGDKQRSPGRLYLPENRPQPISPTGSGGNVPSEQESGETTSGTSGRMTNGPVQVRESSEEKKNIRNEQNLREASIKERKSKEEKEEEAGVKNAKNSASHNDFMPNLLSGTDLSSLSRSLEEFEREYAEMCSSPMMPYCQNGTLQDSSVAMAIKASCARMSSGGATVSSSSGGSLRSRKNSEEINEGPAEKTDIICAKSQKGIGKCRSAENSPKIPRRNVLHNERNLSKNNKDKSVDDADISQRIEDLTKTVRELQNSLSSLDSVELSDDELVRQEKRKRTSKGEKTTGTSGKSLKEEKNVNRSREHAGNEIKETPEVKLKERSDDLDSKQGQGQSQESPETLSPEVLLTEDNDQPKERAAMLDTLVGGFSSSGEGEESDEYVYLSPEDAPSDLHVIDRVRVMPDGKQKVRVTPAYRKAVDVDTFIRYSEPEHKAISTFSFLEDMSSSTSQSQSEEDTAGGVRKKPTCLRNGKIAREQSAVAAKGKLSHRSDADGAATNPQMKANSENSNCKGKVSQSATNRSAKTASENAKLKPRPMNRTVLALREESKKDNRLSNVSFEAASFGSDGICLSDSCCEEFSSGGSDSDAAKA